jgi:hypothetical protein
MKLPSSWKQITIKQYLEIDTIIKDTSLELVERYIQILAAISGQSTDYFESIPIRKLKEYIRKLDFLSHPEEIKTKIPSSFWLKGRRYSVSWRVTTLTGGQYIDLNVFTKDKDAITANLHNIMAVLCLPRKWWVFKSKYNGQQHKDRAALFYDNLSMAIAYPLAVFFCNLSVKLMPHIVLYLEEQESQIRKTMTTGEAMTDIMSNGDGL